MLSLLSSRIDIILDLKPSRVWTIEAPYLSQTLMEPSKLAVAMLPFASSIAWVIEFV